MYVTGFSSNDEAITLPCVAKSYDDVAEFIVNLKSIDCVDDVYVNAVNIERNEEVGEDFYTFTLTCKFTDPRESIVPEDEEAEETAE
jgi:type IV pilus assembly protein PilM